MTVTTVFITGANRGIGRGLAEAFLARPNHIVFAGVRDLNSTTATSLKAVPVAEGSSVVLVEFECREPLTAKAALKTVAAQGVDHLDIVIANAGISGAYAKVDEIEIADLREMFETNTVGTVSLLTAAFPLLKATADQKGAGKPIFVAITTQASSIQNLKDNTPYLLGSYGASKVAINYLVRRAQFETEWLTAFVVDPGSHSFSQTDMGNEGAKRFGFDQAFVPVKDSVAGIVKHIDNATRETSSGKFFCHDDSETSF
ncbi:hypothetical protein BX600DRAFT_519970 [Xylariales sp. PMI_506]|nr:hypothetical protein BX600DRAFT_519970 [Xylariales sp. PMI_506]